MCGVAGIFAYHYPALPVDRDELRLIRDHMSARGPDGFGEWFSDDGRVGLGHRRLSIIDLSEAGAQPMRSSCGRYVISFNGEIYNYRELRLQLEAKGFVFKSESDTEVLLNMYADAGVDMLKRLRGMFAFGLWDEEQGKVLLARDPYGIKPLYVADDGWTCRFASQVKALAASPKVAKTSDPAGMAGFYLLGSVPEPYTVFREIRCLEAGHYQWITAVGAERPARYSAIAAAWTGSAGFSTTLTSDDAQEAIYDALRDSVRAHLIADVPVGAFLSAGIDSGALVGMMRDCTEQPIKTITLGFTEFRGSANDETQLAAEVARRYRTEHSSRMVDFDEFATDLPKILDAMDQPSIDGINTWFVCKAAREAGLKVAVSGVGGDELFGGYPSFREVPRLVRAAMIPGMIPGLGRAFEAVGSQLAQWLPRVPPKAAGLLRYGGSWSGAWFLKRGLFLPSELPQVMGTHEAHEGLRRLGLERHVASNLPLTGADDFAKVAAFEASLYMRNQLLRDTDWASMAHSLEVRTPLVDFELLSRVAALRPRIKPQHFNKQILARAPSQKLPDVLISRPKTGFTTPVATWQSKLPRRAGGTGQSGPASSWARVWAQHVPGAQGQALGT
jgi:asparagine synthase (glutamine-hydrolysing)